MVCGFWSNATVVNVVADGHSKQTLDHDNHRWTRNQTTNMREDGRWAKNENEKEILIAKWKILLWLAGKWSIPHTIAICYVKREWIPSENPHTHTHAILNSSTCSSHHSYPANGSHRCCRRKTTNLWSRWIRIKCSEREQKKNIRHKKFIIARRCEHYFCWMHIRFSVLSIHAMRPMRELLIIIKIYNRVIVFHQQFNSVVFHCLLAGMLLLLLLFEGAMNNSHFLVV